MKTEGRTWRNFVWRMAIAAGVLCFLTLFTAAGLGENDPSAQPPAATLAGATYESASVLTRPGLRCNLHASDEAPSSGAIVFTDHDGYARFHAVRAGKDDAVNQLILDCADRAGNTSTYFASLNSAEIFEPHPLNLAQEEGVDRPALKDDPKNYTQSQLIQAGYGLRPDREKNPKAYARWLAAASVSGRMVRATRPVPTIMNPPRLLMDKSRAPISKFDAPVPSSPATSHVVTPRGSSTWVGSVLKGSPLYVSSEAMFNVPAATPGGAGTTYTEMTIWNGVGGYNAASGLIQGGVTIYTTPTYAAYSSFREFCCGLKENDSGIGGFSPSPGDKIFSQEWYCDKDGNVNLNGGYGCTLLVDMNSLAILSCTSATGSPCPSVPGGPACVTASTPQGCLPLGVSAEFIIENQGLQVGCSTKFAQFSPQVDMAGSANSTTNSILTVSSDPQVDLLNDSVNNPVHLQATLDIFDDTYFTWAPSSLPESTDFSVGTDTHPSLAAFQGSLYAAWKCGSNQNMFWSRFDGRSWTPPRFGIGTGTSTGPVLAAYKNRLYAAWKGVAGDQRMFWSSFDGNNWSPEQQGVGVRSSTEPALAVFGDRLYAAWKGQEGDQRMFWSSFDGNTWSGEQQGVGVRSSTGPALAAFGNYLYAAWKGQEGDQRMFWSRFDGHNWSAEQQGVGVRSSTGPSLAVLGNSLYAAWKGQEGDQRMFWSRFDGKTWSAELPGVGTGTSTGPILAPFQNHVYAAWKGVEGDQRIFWSSFDGTNWSHEQLGVGR